MPSRSLLIDEMAEVEELMNRSLSSANTKAVLHTPKTPLLQRKLSPSVSPHSLSFFLSSFSSLSLSLTHSLSLSLLYVHSISFENLSETTSPAFNHAHSSPLLQLPPPSPRTFSPSHPIATLDVQVDPRVAEQLKSSLTEEISHTKNQRQIWSKEAKITLAASKQHNDPGA
jgi:hypothetical protein